MAARARSMHEVQPILAKPSNAPQPTVLHLTRCLRNEPETAHTTSEATDAIRKMMQVNAESCRSMRTGLPEWPLSTVCCTTFRKKSEQPNTRKTPRSANIMA